MGIFVIQTRIDKQIKIISTENKVGCSSSVFKIVYD